MASVCLAVLVVAVAALGPAPVFVRRLRLRPAETLVASVGLSLLALYAVSWAIYLAKVPVGAHLAVALSFLVLLAASFPTLKALVASLEVRRVLAAWGIYSLYAVALLALVRSHSGGGWAGDWYEHYERALFFLNRGPLDATFIGEWTLSARPPLMNHLEGHVLAVAGRSYPAYQVASTLFSALLILPVLLIARLFTRRPGRVALVLALFLLNPMIAENATYSWTKPFAAFYAVAGVAFYAAGVTLRSRSRVVLGFVFAAAGTLAHYSAAPYLLFIAGWEVVRAWRGGAPVRRELLAATGVAGLVLASWFAWSLTVFGPAGTGSGTPTAVYAESLSAGGLVLNSLKNVWATLVPHVVRSLDTSTIEQASALGALRDGAFLVYQTNLVFGMGACGALLALWPRRGERLRAFWLAFVGVTAVAGIAVATEKPGFGVAHLCLQGLLAAGLARAASRWDLLPAGVRRAACVLGAIDFALGIALTFWIQAIPLGDVRAFPVDWPARTPGGLSWAAYSNALAKETYGTVYLGDLLAGGRSVIAGGVLLLAGWALFRLSRTPSRSPGRGRYTSSRLPSSGSSASSGGGASSRSGPPSSRAGGRARWRRRSR